ncbi:unnamed protein product [Sphagnum balticum]
MARKTGYASEQELVVLLPRSNGTADQRIILIPFLDGADRSDSVHSFIHSISVQGPRSIGSNQPLWLAEQLGPNGKGASPPSTIYPL